MADTPTETPVVVKSGDVLEYAREDAGMSIDSEDLYLAPGETITVGEDVDEEFGQRLIDLQVCRLQPPATKAKAKAAPAEAAAGPSPA